MAITTKEATEHLFKIAQNSPFRIAPEKAKELAYEIFGEDWTILPSETEANFYAIPNENKIYLSYAQCH